MARGCIAVDQTRQCRASVSGFDDRCRSLAHVPPAAGRVARAPGGGRALVGREPREKRSHEERHAERRAGAERPMRGGPPSRGWSPQNGGNRPAGFPPAHIHLGRRSRRTRRRGYVASRRRVRQVSRGAPQELHAQDAGFAAVVHDTRGARARRLHRPHVPAAAVHLR